MFWKSFIETVIIWGIGFVVGVLYGRHVWKKQ